MFLRSSLHEWDEKWNLSYLFHSQGGLCFYILQSYKFFLYFHKYITFFFIIKTNTTVFYSKKYRGVAFFDYDRWIVISYYKLPFLRLRRLNYKIKKRRLQSACVYVAAFVFLLHDYGNCFSISCWKAIEKLLSKWKLFINQILLLKPQVGLVNP